MLDKDQMPSAAGRRVGLALVAAAASLALLSGCDGCGDTAAPTEAAAEIPRPTTPADVSRYFASHVPATSLAFIAVRDLNGVLAAYTRLRPHVAATLGEGDLGMLETDLRNTLGLDLARPGSLEEAGIALDGGLAVMQVGSRAFGAVLVSDAARFRGRITSTLQGRPFDLSAPVEEETRGSATVLSFRHQAGGDKVAIVVLDPPVAYVFPDASGPDVDAVVSTVLSPPAQTLAGEPTFEASIAQAEGFPLQVFAAGAGLAARDEAVHGSGEGCCEGNARMRQVARALGDLTLGLRLTASGLEVRATVTPGDAAYRRFSEVTASEGDPAFGNIANSEVFSFVRMTLAPELILRGLRGLLTPEERGKVDASLAAVDTMVGEGGLDAVLPALGSNVMVLLTRARLLTLSRAMNSGSPGEFFSGLGVVIAFEADDPARLIAVARHVAEQLGNRATILEEAGVTILEFNDAEADIGSIVVTDRFAVLVPARQRAEVLAQLTGAQPDLTWLDVDAARQLVTSPTANGLFVDVRRVVEGPIGQVALARVPEQGRRLLGRIERLTVTTAASDGHVVTDIAVRLTAPEAATP